MLTPPPTPVRFLQALSGHQQTSALKCAVELELFTAIAAGHRTVAALSEHCHASPKGIRVLCDYLTVHQFLTKENGHYALTADSAVFLDHASPAYLGGITAMIAGPTLRQAFEDLLPVVRKGGTVLNGEGGSMSRENPVWKDFARSMGAMMMPAANWIAQSLKASEGAPMKVLDLAAGHGMFGITIARANPKASIHAVDWASVLDIAREHAVSAGVANRWHAIAGSAFEVEFGGDYDAVLITNFHHHFNPSVIETLMRKVRAALKPDGVAVTFEFVPNDDRVTPPEAAAFAMIMLATTAEGDAYTFAEYERMYRDCGFTRNELHRLEQSPGAVILSRR
ncbi:MAG: 3-hydroxy-5-methyl-1-naphthoate 3-O-methyltransferase [Bryobacteraceae bacterium]|nr:3-hydroxy-5-methyl-1-naphthoate 3-O-methyltransferase [Bryobacteraceae bacterium]